MLRTVIAAALAAVLVIAVPAFAQTGHTQGEVRKVDRESGKITLRHGPITGELDMPAMSMVFQVKQPALLEQLKPGDRIEAVILKENGGFFIQSAVPQPR
ncbi:MAG: copper-binding protein [Ferrovibrio sp.]